MSVRLACLLAAGPALIAAAQQPPRYNETVNVKSVMIDVRVLDEAGRSIGGLTADDFSVKIGGNPVHVQSAAWVGDAGTIAVPDRPSAPAAVPAAPAGRLIVLLFQRSLANYRAAGLVRKLVESRDLVRGLADSDRVAILAFDTSLTIWTDFTSDRAALDRILERGVLFERPPAVAAESPAPSLVAHLDAKTARRAYTIERAFELIGNALEPLPGSKAIAFFGWGMGRLTVGTTGSVANAYAKAERALTNARATVFSLDITMADSHSLAVGLQRIAADTGGFYASSLDFPERPMRWLSGALRGYYVLFVDPPDQQMKARDVSVVLTRRQAYVFATPSYPASASPPR